MEKLKKVNQCSGIVTAISLITAVIYVLCEPLEPKTAFHYVLVGVLTVFGAVFLATCAVVIVNNFVWHLRHKRLRLFVRHYLYAVVISFVILILFRYIAMGTFDWIISAKYCFLLAVVEPVVTGLNKIQPQRKLTEELEEKIAE